MLASGHMGHVVQPILDGLQAGHLITTMHGDVSIQASKGVLI